MISDVFSVTFQRSSILHYLNLRVTSYQKQMLVRPPKLISADDNQSQVQSQSHKSRTSANKSKNKKKESSLVPNSRNRNHSNASDHSQRSHSPYQIPQSNNDHNFDLPLNIESNINHQNRDNASVGSYASNKSKKKAKKQTSLKKQKGNKLIGNNSRQMENSIKVMNYAEDYDDDYENNIVQQSQVKGMGFDQSPYKFRTLNNNDNNEKHITKPFSQIQVDDEDLPVLRIQQNPKNIVNRDRGTPKIAERVSTKKFNQLLQENNIKNSSNNTMGQAQQKLNINNNKSQISESNWNNSSIGQSRRSKSKLGALFKQKNRQQNQSKIDTEQSRSKSRRKNIFDGNKKNNQSGVSNNNSSISTNKNYQQKNFSELQAQKQQKLYEQSRIGGSRLQTHASKQNNMEQKRLEQSQDMFDQVDLTRSQLNLSQSHNAGYTHHQNSNGSNAGNSFAQKDSLCFNIEAQKVQKRKGLGLVSKTKNSSQQKDMVKVSGELKSVALGLANDRNQQMVRIPGILQSKPLDAHAKLINNLKQNQKYLAESGFTVQNQQHSNNFQRQAYEKRERQTNEKREKQYKRKQQIQKVKSYQKQQRQQQQKQRIQYERQQQRRIQKIRIKQQKMRIQQQEEYQRELQQIKQQKQQKQLQRKLLKQQEKQRQKERSKERQRQIERQRQQLKEQENELQRERQLQNKKQQERKLQKQQRKRLTKERQIQQKQQQQYKPKIQKQMKNNTKQIPELQQLPSTYSRQHSSNGSQKSRSQGKAHKKKQSSISVKKNKKRFVGDISPRAQESFYEDFSNDQSTGNPKEAQQTQNLKIASNTTNAPKRKLLSFSEEEEEDNVPSNDYDINNKFKTDSNFYDQSVKVPSSRPPLSKKSVSSSKGKSKPKQSSIIPTKKTSKINSIREQPGGKKLSLVQLALQKQYQPRSGSEYSNESFGSGESRSQSKNSRDNRRQYSNYSNNNSVNSRNSGKSQKKQSVIRIKQNPINSSNKPPAYRRYSPQLTGNSLSHQRQLEQIESQRQQIRTKNQLYSQPIVSKDCSFIDERGRLVKRDMVIKGNKVYSGGQTQFDPNQVYNRLKRSREKRQSRSRQKSLSRSGSSRNLTGANNTMTSFNSDNEQKYDKSIPMFVESEAYCDSAEQSTHNFYNTQGNGARKTNQGSRNVQMPFNNSNSYSNGYNNNYNNNSNNYRKQNNTQHNGTLNQFLKPIQICYNDNKKVYKNNQVDNQQKYQIERQRSRDGATRKRRMPKTEKSGNSASKKIRGVNY